MPFGIPNEDFHGGFGLPHDDWDCDCDNDNECEIEVEKGECGDEVVD